MAQSHMTRQPNAHALRDDVNISTVIYAIDEQGREILKEHSQIHNMLTMRDFQMFKQNVEDFIGVAHIAEEIGFLNYDVLYYRTNQRNERLAIRTQNQYNLETRLFNNKHDRLEVMICKKIMAWVKGRLGSVVIVSMEIGGGSGMQIANAENPTVFQPDHPVMDNRHRVLPTSRYAEEEFDPAVESRSQVKKRRRDPRIVEDAALIESIRSSDHVTRNERQQRTFEELADMLKELSGTYPVTEGKYQCGNCGKERLVCPSRNNIGRVKYFRRKHYDKCLKLLPPKAQIDNSPDNSVASVDYKDDEEDTKGTERTPAKLVIENVRSVKDFTT